MRAPILALTAAIVTCSGVLAEPLRVGEARRQLFRTEQVEVSVNPAANLDAEEEKALQALIATNSFKFYGAIAFAPSEGLISETLQGAFNYHDALNAQEAAVAACNAVRPQGTPGCIVAAQVLPRQWEPRDFQLSQDATAEFDEFRRLRGDKAFAISATSGGFGVGEGGTADVDALIECNRNAPARDCVIVVKN